MIARYAGGESGARGAAKTGAVIIVVDAFRASTTIAVLLSKGRPRRSGWIPSKRPHPLRPTSASGAGELKVAGFDFGKSPTEILAAEIQPGSTVALSTTNGTRIIEAAFPAPAIFTGAFVNATALADVLATDSAGGRVTVVGCGWEGHHASEDEAAAGAILYRLRSRGTKLDGRAGRAVERYLSRPVKALLNNSAARRLKRLGYERDLEFCLSEDTVPVVPCLVGGTFVGCVLGSG